MKRIESVIQAAVIRWVKDNHPIVIITTTANERSYKETRQIGSIGIPDLILFDRKGRALFLELKKLKGKLSPVQIEWNTMFDGNFTAKNYTRDVAYGYNSAIEIINRWAALSSSGELHSE